MTKMDYAVAVLLHFCAMYGMSFMPNSTYIVAGTALFLGIVALMKATPR